MIGMVGKDEGRGRKLKIMRLKNWEVNIFILRMINIKDKDFKFFLNDGEWFRKWVLW